MRVTYHPPPERPTMHRRTALRAAGAALAAGCVPAALSSATPTGVEQDAFQPRSRLGLPGAKEVVVGPDGRTAYVAVTDGFATVDVSDPDAPQLLAERRGLLGDREDGPMRRVHDVAVEGDRLAVAGPANGVGVSGVLLYDVTDPAAPERLGFHETSYPVHNCDLADGVVYLTANNARDNPVVLVDAREDSLPEVARWSLYDLDEAAWSAVHLGGRAIHDVTVVDAVAYCAYWDAGTWLLDVSEPSDPRLLGSVGGFTAEELAGLDDAEKGFQSIEPPGNAHYTEVNDDGTVLAVGGESWDGHAGDGHGGPSGIDLWDVSDPAAPERLSSIEPLVPADATVQGTWTTAHNFELVGGRLYSAWYQDGVKLHDVSDPSSPELLAHWRDPVGTRFWTARLGRPGDFFVAADMAPPGQSSDDAALYCFPDRAGTQLDQPDVRTPTPTPTSTPAGRSPGTGTPPGTGGTESPTGTRTRSPTATQSDEPTGTPSETSVPGFGALAALGGLGLAGWRLLARRE